MDLRQILNRPPKRQRIDEEGDAHAQRSPSYQDTPSWSQNPPATAAVQSQRHCSTFSNSASTTPNATPIHTALRTGSHCYNERGNCYSQPGYTGHLAADLPSQKDQPLHRHPPGISNIPVTGPWPPHYSMHTAPIAPLQPHAPIHASYYDQSFVPQTLPNQANVSLQWPDSYERQTLSPFIPDGSTPPHLLVDESSGTAEAQDTTICFGMVSNTRNSLGRSSTKIQDFGHLCSVRAKRYQSAKSTNTVSSQARIFHSIYCRRHGRGYRTDNVRTWTGCTRSS